MIKQEFESPTFASSWYFHQHDLCIEAGREGDAIKFLDEIIRLYPHLGAEAHCKKSILLIDDNRRAEAVESIKYVIQSPYSTKEILSIVYFNIAILISDKEEGMEMALDFYDDAIELNPQNVHAYANKAVLLHKMGYREDALKCYYQIFALNKAHPYIYTNMAILLSELEDFPKSLEYFNKALELSPQDHVTLSSKAYVLSKIGYIREAISHYEEAISINPDLAQTKDYLDLLAKESSE